VSPRRESGAASVAVRPTAPTRAADRAARRGVQVWVDSGN